MKKKFRDIIVDDVSYAWAYKPNCDKYEGGGTLKIWKDKKVIYENWVDADVDVTPSYIAELISVVEDYGDVSFK